VGELTIPWFGVDKEKGHAMLSNEVGNCETQDFHCAARTGLCSIRAHRSQRPNRTRRALKASRSMTETEKRFWAKVNKTETCWLWTAARRFDKRHAPDFSDEQGMYICGCVGLLIRISEKEGGI